MVEIIIDAKGAIYGRLCSYAAKQALAGNEIRVINSEQAIMTGNKKDLINKYWGLRRKGGHSQKGPKYSKLAYQMLRRGIRGMLPDFRKGIGKQAFSKIRCHNGLPNELKDKKAIKMPGVNQDKYITLKELSEKI